MEMIRFPFKREMIDQIFKGNKICTWRSKTWGESGTGFELEHCGEVRRFKILGVVPMQPWYVGEFLYISEGFSSRERFLNYLQALKTPRWLDVEQWGYEHFFMRIDSDGRQGN